MIAARLGKTSVYRVLVPKWSFAPTSGDGAGKHGGGPIAPAWRLYICLQTPKLP